MSDEADGADVLVNFGLIVPSTAIVKEGQVSGSGVRITTSLSIAAHFVGYARMRTERFGRNICPTRMLACEMPDESLGAEVLLKLWRIDGIENGPRRGIWVQGPDARRTMSLSIAAHFVGYARMRTEKSWNIYPRICPNQDVPVLS
ncbi:hypothetical protein PSTT_09026 [Puccinia striiformis]|uniref:Uncharacterized protein n=3 Tax=Puccinia striiformis TaxID=27350 RepID=A0A0L0UTL8_9BASI|nr:hypothetical protein PSTG_16307 [Puccinia striiformis f. sp. tritici PST-78]POW06388.1 hypothetical protein PSTT_09026 [Puccinia striiformis]